jgi:4-amino-4-deoxy-L-arabinose transferase-like glycosyltransferase
LARLKKRENAPATLAPILAGAALLRLYALSAESFWFDEAYSVWVARHSVGWHIALSTQRIFPPLYYLCLHFWLALGDSEFAVRSLSVLVGLLSVAAIYLLARQLSDERVGLFSALLLAISPLHIWYSQEARMYILVVALSLCSAYFMLLSLRQGRIWHWFAYVLSTALLMNAHYFAVFLVPFQNAFVLYLLLRRRAQGNVVWHWLLSQLLVGLLSVIGLAGIFSAESSYWWGLLDTWHGAPGFANLLGLMFKFSLGTTVQGRLIYWSGLSLFGFCILWGLLALVRGRVPARGNTSAPGDSQDMASPKEWPGMAGVVFVLLYLLVPVGTVFALSQVQSFWVLRYIFPFLPPYCILVAHGLARMPVKLRLALTGLMVALSVLPIVNIYRYEQKENWRGVVEYIAAHEKAGDVILLVDEDIWLPFEHYYRGSTRRLGISRSIHDRDLLAARVGMILPSHGRIWLILSHTDNWMIRDYLAESRYTELSLDRDFAGVHVDLLTVRLDGNAL